jgi:hypothetical protein
MKYLFAMPMMAALMASPAFAQTTATTTRDGPRYDATRTTTVDPTTGTYSRSGSVTNNATGQTATRQVNGQRTADGVSVSGGSTRMNGQTTSFGYNRSRTATGATATGSYTGRYGNTYNYSGNVTRNGNGTGYSTARSITGPYGGSVYRNSAVSRTGSGVTRTISRGRR